MMITKLKAICSCALMVLLVSSILVVVELPALSVAVNAQPPSTASATTSALPSVANLVTRGNAFVTLVEQSAQFKSLAHGVSFYVDPYSSYGFSSGPVAQDDYVMITLFSSNREAIISANVNNVTGAITYMSFSNLTSIVPKDASSYNWSGYAAPDCESSLFGWCYNFNPVSEAYGNVQAPSSLTAPKTEQACCAVSEWTGIGNTASGTGMSQGGFEWQGFQLPSLPNSINGWALFVEDLYDNTPQIPLLPPLWMNGVAGQTITLKTQALTVCGISPLENEWWEIWQMGSSSVQHQIACVPNTYAYYWGYYILESPFGGPCAAAGWNEYCQLPDFSPTLTFTGNICSGSCEYINSNNNAGLAGSYIVHNTQDTTTGGIPANGNQWSESWDSPGT
jgi:hypothetical protein